METVAVNNRPAFTSFRFQDQGSVVIHVHRRTPGCAAGGLDDHLFADGGGVLFPLWPLLRI